jgi:hypothetical protein
MDIYLSENAALEYSESCFENPYSSGKIKAQVLLNRLRFWGKASEKLEKDIDNINSFFKNIIGEEVFEAQPGGCGILKESKMVFMKVEGGRVIVFPVDELNPYATYKCN